MKKSTHKAFSPSNSLFISIQFHRLGVIFGTTSTHGCKHIASSCFYRGLWYCGLRGLFNGRSGHGFKPHPMKYHWFKSPITFKVGISSNDRAGLKFIRWQNTKALQERKNTAPGNVSLRTAPGGSWSVKRNPEAMNSEKAVHSAEGWRGYRWKVTACKLSTGGRPNS